MFFQQVKQKWYSITFDVAPWLQIKQTGDKKAKGQKKENWLFVESSQSYVPCGCLNKEQHD